MTSAGTVASMANPPGSPAAKDMPADLRVSKSMLLRASLSRFLSPTEAQTGVEACLPDLCVTQPQRVQLLGQELLTVDPHASQPDDL